MASRVRSAGALLVTLIALSVAFTAPARGQVPVPSSTTTTTAPEATTTTTTAATTTSTTRPSSTTTTRPSSTTTTTLLLGGSPTTTSTTTTTAPSDGTPPPENPPPGEAPDPGEGDEPADPGAEDGAAPAPSRTVPAEAQKIINSVQRSGPSNTAVLLEGIDELVSLGLSRDEALRIGMGRFPIGGYASYIHDWLFPRYGPGFRFHLGTDVFADFGTPLRAVVDGWAESGVGNLGGLYVRVHMDDGTYFYYAHLAGIPEGFVNGMKVKTGDIVGFVGDSGNASGGSPHLHIGIYPQSGSAIDPKPVLDGFLQDAIDRMPEIIEQVRNRQAVTVTANSPVALPSAPTVSRPLLSTTLLQGLGDRVDSATVSTEALYVALGDAPTAGVAFLDAHASALAGSIDWDRRAVDDAGRIDLLRRSEALAMVALEPFLDLPERRAVVEEALALPADR